MFLTPCFTIVEQGVLLFKMLLVESQDLPLSFYLLHLNLKFAIFFSADKTALHII